MRLIAYIIILIIITPFLISCEKDIEFKGSITDPLMVLNSMLTPDSVVSVHLSQSRFVLGEISPLKNTLDASVSVIVNGDLKEQLNETKNGIYVGSYFPKPADNIEINVITEGFSPVSSQTVIPKKPTVVIEDSTVSLYEDITYNSKSRTMELQLKLTDDIMEENYYYIKATQYYYSQEKFLNKRVLDINLSEVLKNNFTNNENFFEEFLSDGGISDRTDNLFSDQFINGKDIIFNFSFYDTLKTKTNLHEDLGEITVEYLIEVGQVSKDLYHYIISGNKAENNKDIPFIEPVLIHSNINNGIGVLGSYNTYRLSFSFQSNYYPFYRR